MAVVEAVTLPACWDAVTIETGELLWLTAFPCVLDTVFAVVGQVPFPLIRTLAFWAQWTCKEKLQEVREFKNILYYYGTKNDESNAQK